MSRDILHSAFNRLECVTPYEWGDSLSVAGACNDVYGLADSTETVNTTTQLPMA